MRRWVSVLLVFCMLISFSACDDYDDYGDYGDDEGSGAQSGTQTVQSDETWAIYWYLCGSDLESGNGFATDDLIEMTQVDLPDNVEIIIQTGGAGQWFNEYVYPENSQRFRYSALGLELLETDDAKNMGDQETFSEFLTFCLETYPADRQGVLMWNHGGGSVSGIAVDEQFGGDMLSLMEVYNAMLRAIGEEPEEPVFEFFGFDACLMATLETAFVLEPFSRYMVASQETEPAIGWDYEGFLSALAENPGMDGAELGRVICDTYAQSCEEYDLADMITLSVVDLTKLPPLLTAYANMGIEALANMGQNGTFFAAMSRSARRAENYGGNTRGEGFSNMVDLGELVELSESLLPEYSDDVLAALKNCVVYTINGDCRTQANGLSCYFPYDGEIQTVEEYWTCTPSQAFYYLYEYGVSGRMSSDAIDYYNSMAYLPMDEAPDDAQDIEAIEEAEDLPTMSELALEGFPVTIAEDGSAMLELGPETADHLAAVYFWLMYYDEEADVMILLGQDNDLNADWENGVIWDNFRGVWCALDDELVYMEILYEGDDYNLYSIPILLNGEAYCLRVSYSFVTEEYSILGAKKGLYDNGMSDRNLVKLQPGDEVTTLHYMASFSGDDELEQYEVATVTVTQNTQIHEVDLGDGTFMMMFDMVDGAGNSALSETIGLVTEGDYYYFERVE